MSGEVERPGIEGKVITGGLAQTVTREKGVVRVELLRVPGQPMAHTTYGSAAMSIPLPEPVTVEAGELLVVDMGWLPEAERASTGVPIHMPHAATIRSVITAPSVVRPGHAQAAVSDAAEPDMLPDLFTSRLGR